VRISHRIEALVHPAIAVVILPGAPLVTADRAVDAGAVSADDVSAGRRRRRRAGPPPGEARARLLADPDQLVHGAITVVVLSIAHFGPRFDAARLIEPIRLDITRLTCARGAAVDTGQPTGRAIAAARVAGGRTTASAAGGRVGAAHHRQAQHQAEQQAAQVRDFFF